jgi:hypothetical protein
MLKYAYLLGAKLALDSQSGPGADAFAAMIQMLSAGAGEDSDEGDKASDGDGPVSMSRGDEPSWGAPVRMENSQDG